MPKDPHTKSISTTQGPVFVKACGCGGIHLCIGGVSINLARETAVFLQAQLQNLVSPSSEHGVVIPIKSAVQN